MKIVNRMILLLVFVGICSSIVFATEILPLSEDESLDYYNEYKFG